jgi:hypothetical protein
VPPLEMLEDHEYYQNIQKDARCVFLLVLLLSTSFYEICRLQNEFFLGGGVYARSPTGRLPVACALGRVLRAWKYCLRLTCIHSFEKYCNPADGAGDANLG